MDSAANTRQADPHVNPALSTQEIELVARADERLAHAYEQIARADEELARFNEQISRLEKKPVNRLRQPSRGRPALRGLMGLLLTAGICTAAVAWQSHGETVRPMISRWVPQLAAASSLPSEASKLAHPQSPPAVQVAAADAAVSQSPPPAQTTPQDAAAAEQTQLLQTMARDLASVQQELEQLKASQAELARESARTAEQLKANQEQMARVIANASEQNLRPRTSAATSAARSAATSANPPRPVATPARKPVPTAPATQARAQARAPVQLQSRQQ
jgi:septal ring factor EnvC (AmiA/AmiB activator)